MSVCTECGREMDDFEAQEWYACGQCRLKLEGEGRSLRHLLVRQLRDFREPTVNQRDWEKQEDAKLLGKESRLWLRRTIEGAEDIDDDLAFETEQKEAFWRRVED